MVTHLAHAQAAPLLEAAFPRQAPRLTASLVSGLRSGSSEALRHLVPQGRPDRVLWLTASGADVQAAQVLGVTSALALWAQRGRALEAGPDLLVDRPEALTGALRRHDCYAWPLEQGTLSPELRTAPVLVKHEVAGSPLDVFVLGRYAPARAAKRHNPLVQASQDALSFKYRGTQAPLVAEIIRTLFPDHLVALMPSTQQDSALGTGLTELEGQLQVGGMKTLRLAWLRVPATRQKAAGGIRARVQNVERCLASPDTALVRGRLVMIVDDVVTTGATLSEARRALLAAGAHVTCLAVAKALITGHRAPA